MTSQTSPTSNVVGRSGSEARILSLLDDGRARTVEEVITGLPDISWAQLFIAMDILSRRGDIELRRQGFSYTLKKATRWFDQAGGADAAPHSHCR